MQNVAFIINPISGIGKQRGIEAVIQQAIDTSRFVPHWFYTQAPKDGTRLALEAMKTCDIIVAVGGDGSVNDVAKALINTNKILGIIPCGSGNGLARHLNLPLTVTEAIKHLQKGTVQAIDTLSINDMPCISIAGVGFDAEIAHQFNKNKKRGLLKYAQIAIGNFLIYREKKYKLSLNGHKLETRALMINFANSNQFGYGFQIAPKASLSDGLIDVVIVKKPNIFRCLFEAIRFLKNKFYQSKYCEIIQTASLTIKQKNSNLMNIDGEAVWMPNKIHISTLPESLRVIC